MRWVSLATTFPVPNIPNLVYATQIVASHWAETNLTLPCQNFAGHLKLECRPKETVNGKREMSKHISIGGYLQNM